MSKDKETVVKDKETVVKDKETVKPWEEWKKTPKYPKMSGNGKNSPVMGAEAGLKTNEGDTAKYLKINMALYNMEKINLRDTEQLDNRIAEYFNLYMSYDTKPTVMGLAMALGMNRRTLYGITHDKPIGGKGNYSNLPSESTLRIKNAYNLLENLWETYMQNGKINPVSGIFLGKNNYGYRDKVEYEVTPNVKSSEDYSVDDIKKRYSGSDYQIEETPKE